MPPKRPRQDNRDFIDLRQAVADTRIETKKHKGVEKWALRGITLSLTELNFTLEQKSKGMKGITINGYNFKPHGISYKD